MPATSAGMTNQRVWGSGKGAKRRAHARSNRVGFAPLGPPYARRPFPVSDAEFGSAQAAMIGLDISCRLYCDALRFWRRCTKRPCKRHRRCTGDAFHCLEAGHYLVPPSQRARARNEVLGGGPRRIPPATHIEWTVRRNSFGELLRWQLG